MNGHCGITGSTYRPVEPYRDEKPQVSPSRWRITAIIFIVEAVGVMLLIQYGAAMWRWL